MRAFGDFSEGSGYTAMSELLDHSPDAVFAASDGMALGAIRRIQDAGLSIPQDIAVIGFDGFTKAETHSPSHDVGATGVGYRLKAVEMFASRDPW